MEVALNALVDQPDLGNNEMRGDAFRRPAGGTHRLYPVYSPAIACVTT